MRGRVYTHRHLCSLLKIHGDICHSVNIWKYGSKKRKWCTACFCRTDVQHGGVLKVAGACPCTWRWLVYIWMACHLDPSSDTNKLTTCHLNKGHICRALRMKVRRGNTKDINNESAKIKVWKNKELAEGPLKWYSWLSSITKEIHLRINKLSYFSENLCRFKLFVAL